MQKCCRHRLYYTFWYLAECTPNDQWSSYEKPSGVSQFYNFGVNWCVLWYNIVQTSSPKVTAVKFAYKCKYILGMNVTLELDIEIDFLYWKLFQCLCLTLTEYQELGLVFSDCITDLILCRFRFFQVIKISFWIWKVCKTLKLCFTKCISTASNVAYLMFYYYLACRNDRKYFI